jgi:hypothetical protein
MKEVRYIMGGFLTPIPNISGINIHIPFKLFSINIAE